MVSFVDKTLSTKLEAPAVLDRTVIGDNVSLIEVWEVIPDDSVVKPIVDSKFGSKSLELCGITVAAVLEFPVPNGATDILDTNVGIEVKVAEEDPLEVSPEELSRVAVAFEEVVGSSGNVVV